MRPERSTRAKRELWLMVGGSCIVAGASGSRASGSRATLSLKPSRGQVLDGGEVPGEEEPPVGGGPEAIGVGAEDGRRVVLGVDRDRDQAGVGDVGEGGLELGHPRALDGAGVGAPGEDQVGDPDPAPELGEPQWLAAALGEREVGDGGEDGERRLALAARGQDGEGEEGSQVQDQPGRRTIRAPATKVTAPKATVTARPTGHGARPIAVASPG